MKKLQLDLDQLAVETFATDAPRTERGTVAAHATNGGNTCVYHCTFAGDTCDACPISFACPRTWNC